jgi:hypothetical protein
MNIIMEYSDFRIDTINFFIEKIRAALETKGLNELSNNNVDIVNVSKEHPLVQFMESRINPVKSGDDLRAGVLPGIGVTPGNLDAEMETMGETTEMFIVGDDDISMFKSWLNLTNKELANKYVINKPQIESVLAAYKRKGLQTMRCQQNSWGWNEEVNVSCWSESPDYDTLMFRIIDSVLAKIKVGIVGDNSPMQKMKYKPVRGLTNFNFGRVLYGSEINLTFFNTYSNYTIYTEEHITGFEQDLTFQISGGRA